MNINPGNFDKKIQIIRTVEDGVSANGFQRSHEEVVRSTYAQFSLTSGTELVRANSEFAETKARFLVRYTPVEVNTDMFVRYAGRDHNIKYVNTYGDGREYLEIWTEWLERV